MRSDRLSGIAAFLKVADTRSFTRAAAELGTAPSTLSESVRNLEERLGVRLLNRTTRSVGLTEAGAAYAERVRSAMEEIQSAGAELRETSRRPTGTLRLNLPWIAGPILIEPLMAPFLDAFPDIRLDLVFDDRFVDLAAEGFDAGIRIGELLEKDMIAVRLGGPLRMAVVASPDYLAAHGEPKRPSDLIAHRCIAYRHLSTGAVAEWEFIENGRPVSFTPEPRLSANTMPLAVTAAAQGVGLAFTLERLAAQHLQAGSLVSVLKRFCPDYEPLHIYYPGRRLTPPKLKAFVDFARKHARKFLG